MTVELNQAIYIWMDVIQRGAHRVEGNDYNVIVLTMTQHLHDGQAFGLDMQKLHYLELVLMNLLHKAMNKYFL